MSPWITYSCCRCICIRCTLVNNRLPPLPAHCNCSAELMTFRKLGSKGIFIGCFPLLSHNSHGLAHDQWTQPFLGCGRCFPESVAHSGKQWRLLRWYFASLVFRLLQLSLSGIYLTVIHQSFFFLIRGGVSGTRGKTVSLPRCALLSWLILREAEGFWKAVCSWIETALLALWVILKNFLRQ